MTVDSWNFGLMPYISVFLVLLVILGILWGALRRIEMKLRLFLWTFSKQDKCPLCGAKVRLCGPEWLNLSYECEKCEFKAARMY